MAVSREVCAKLRKYLAEQWENERRKYKDNPDAMFKLNVHFPTVTRVAEMLAPEDYVLQTAADFHDYGRTLQLELIGSFNDGELGSVSDHHVIGYQRFWSAVKDILQADEVRDSLEVLQQVSSAILLHGLRGRAFPQEFAMLDDRTREIVDLVSLIDDVANGVQCAGYLLRECQEQSKNVSRGGFVPDENAELRTVSPRVIQLLRDGSVFDRNKECKTYPDYVVFGTFLAARSLKNPDTRAIALETMSRPITVWHYRDNVRVELVATEYPDALSALNDVFDATMDKQYADIVKGILQNFYDKGGAY